MQGSTSNGGMTVAEILKKSETDIRDAGCDTPEADAMALLAEAMGVEVAQVAARLQEPVSASLGSALGASVARRAAREPLAYILGRFAFRGIEVGIDNRVLVPDEASGFLVELAASLPLGARVHDVGTGSGVIALAIKDERPDLIVTGSDISKAAVEVARANAEALELDVAFTFAPWLPGGPYDLVIANLPYVDTRQDTMEIPPEYTDHQPHVAVYSGEDGLQVIREFVARVETDAMVALQHAPSQTEAVRAFFADPTTAGEGERFGRFTYGKLLG